MNIASTSSIVISARRLIRRPLNLLCGVLALAALAVPARAVPFAVDRLAVGDGQLTRDTVSGLDWLDLSLTLNRSLGDAATLTMPGATYDGFRLATVSEFLSLLTGAGLPNNSTNAADVAAARSLQNLIGAISYPNNGTQYTSSGLLAPDSFNPVIRGNITVWDYLPGGAPDRYASSFTTFVGVSGGDPSPEVGLFLVRSSPTQNNGASVPDAGSSVGLLALSIAGLLAVRRRLAAAVSGTDIS